MKFIAGNSLLRRVNDEIFIDSLPINEFITKFKTPLIILLENRIKENIKNFNKVFASEFKNFHCFYSFKANYLPEICEIVNSEGIGAEVVGILELKLALKLGFPSEKILVGGPYLPDELIDLSIKHGIREIVIYNVENLKKINFYAQKYNIVQNICIRITSQKYGSKLGINIDESTLNLLKDLKKNLSNIRITSILSHYSTQMNNYKQYQTNLNSIITSLKLLLKYGISIDNINLGGGFPEATVMPQRQLRNIAKKIKSHLDESNISYKNIYFEPGRYLVGDSGLFLTKIVRFTNKNWTFLDIGNHICPKFARCSLRFYNASQINEPHKFPTSFAGIMP